MTQAEVDKKIDELEEQFMRGNLSLESYLRNLREIIAKADKAKEEQSQ